MERQAETLELETSGYIKSINYFKLIIQKIACKQKITWLKKFRALDRECINKISYYIREIKQTFLDFTFSCFFLKSFYFEK